LIWTILQQKANTHRHDPIEPGLMMCHREVILFPGKLQPLIEERWEELGFDSLSAYVTSLIRYDLLLSGPHKYFDGRDMSKELRAALDLRTTREFYAERRQKILLDYLIEQAEGRELSPAEREGAINRIVGQLRQNALDSQRQVRRLVR
jgi:hypothetical protein